MKLLKYAAIALLIFVAAIDCGAKKKELPAGYIFGFSASFNDSIAYFTDVQTVEKVWIDTKTGFLLGRDSYSYQLRDYLARQGQEGRTCLVVFSPSKKKLQKTFLKMRRKYTVKAKGLYDVRDIETSDFSFTGVDMSDPIVEEEPAPAEPADNAAPKAQ